MPLAPVLFSTTKDCPVRAARASPTMRATLSMVLPGLKPTTNFTGAPGYAASAGAAPARDNAAQAAASQDLLLFIDASSRAWASGVPPLGFGGPRRLYRLAPLLLFGGNELGELLRCAVGDIAAQRLDALAHLRGIDDARDILVNALRQLGRQRSGGQQAEPGDRKSTRLNSSH